MENQKMLDENENNNEEVVSWEDSVDEYVKLSHEADKELLIKDWFLIKKEKFGKSVVEFQADVLEEDGKKVKKRFATSSNRLKMRLKYFLEELNSKSEVRIVISIIGKGFNTNYKVKVL